MSNGQGNPYVKPLKSFDPKKDLTVNEKFRADGINSKANELSDLEEDLNDSSSGESGKGTYIFKTGGPIKGSVIEIEDNSGKNYLLTGNKLGEVYILSVESGKLVPTVKFKVQGSIDNTPAYADGIVYCATREGIVYAVNSGLNSAAGEKKAVKPQVLWQNKMEKGILSDPIATGKIIIITTLGGLYSFEAYYVDESQKSIGKPVFNQPLNGVASSPRIDSGIIYLGTEDKKLIAFDYGGSKISAAWEYKANEAIRSKPYVSQKGGMVLAGSVDGSVYCLNKSGGQLMWIYIVKAPVYSSIISAFINNKEYFFFGADNGFFYCINSFGKKVWEFKTGSKIRSEALIKGSAIYFGSEDNNLYALNIKNGKLIFNYRTDGNINGKPVISGDTIFFGSTDSFVHGLQI